MWTQILLQVQKRDLYIVRWFEEDSSSLSSSMRRRPFSGCFRLFSVTYLLIARVTVLRDTSSPSGSSRKLRSSSEMACLRLNPLFFARDAGFFTVSGRLVSLLIFLTILESDLISERECGDFFEDGFNGHFICCIYDRRIFKYVSCILIIVLKITKYCQRL